MTYELINPSDAITFKAESDKIAFFCALILGNGKAGISREDGKEVEESPMLMFVSNPLPIIEKYLGCSLVEFKDNNLGEISECFLSFAYGTFSDRAAFDRDVASFKTSIGLEAYLEAHEDRNRSSMSKWVQGAWDYGRAFKNKLNETAKI